MWFYLIIGAFFIAIGLAVHVFKWHFLIAGYNTMSKEKKANVDTEGLGRLMGVYSYVNGGVLIVMGALQAFGLKPFLTPVILIFGISTVYLLIRAQKYDGNIYDKSGKLLEGAWRQFVLPVGTVIVTLIFVAILMLFSSQETKVTFLEEGLQIHGMYGEIYNWESIETARLMEEMPTIEMRINGSALGSNLKGHFRTTELGSVKLFVNTQKSLFIYFETNDRTIIFNMKNDDETKEVFVELSSKTK
jgi:TRAP-type C4-dicarboxylate transport system permease small subunit